MKKYIVVVICLMFITMIGVIFFSNLTSREVHNSMTEKFVSHMKDLSKASAMAIRDDIYSVRRSLRSFVDTLKEHKFDFEDKELKDDIQIIYNNMDFLSVNDIAYLDENGIVRFNENAPQLMGKDFSYREYFKSIRDKGTPDFLAVQLIMFKGVSEGDKGLIFALGVFDESEKKGDPVFKGVVVITSTLNSLIEKYIKPLSISYKGYLWFFKSDGMILYHPNIRVGKTYDELKSSTKFTDSFKSAIMAISKESKLTGKYIEGGEDFVYAASEVEMDDDSWFFVVSMPREDTHDVLSTYSTINLLLTTASVFAVFLFGMFITLLFYIKNQKLLQDMDFKTYQLEYAKSSNEELDAIIHTVAHDLKTPLTSIMGFTEILMTTLNENISEADLNYLSRVKFNAIHMKNLIDSIIEFARVGKASGNVDDISLKALLEEVILQNNYKIEKRGAKVSIPEELPVIKTDKLKLEQVFSNLLSNAIKFVPEERTPIVDFKFFETDEYFNIAVSDNGVGIDEKDLDNIFKLFHRLKDIEAQGTGVGLAIVKKILNEQKGKITVTSQKDIGTTFTVSLIK